MPCSREPTGKPPPHGSPVVLPLHVAAPPSFAVLRTDSCVAPLCIVDSCHRCATTLPTRSRWGPCSAYTRTRTTHAYDSGHDSRLSRSRHGPRSPADLLGTGARHAQSISSTTQSPITPRGTRPRNASSTHPVRSPSLVPVEGQPARRFVSPPSSHWQSLHCGLLGFKRSRSLNVETIAGNRSVPIVTVRNTTHQDHL